MEKRKENKKRKWYMIGSLAVGILMLGILYAGWSVWKEYSTSILNIQKEQMLITVDSVASHLEHELDHYADDVMSLCDIAEYGRQNDAMENVYYAFMRYAANKSDEIGSLILKDQNGSVIWGDDRLSYPNRYGRYSVGEEVDLSACKGNDGELYFVFTKQSAGGLQPELAISIRNFLGNEAQMKQVILNLCMNAFHAIGKEKDGRVAIHATLEGREQIEELHQIRIAREWDFYICIRISDNGCGMNEETRRQIFAPFFTTKKTGQGTGLGLSVAEQIIHSHKGYICVKSESGKGSDFYIYLPLSEEKSMGGLRSDSMADLQESHMKILIVDDNEKVLHLLKKAFERMKIQVSTAETPEEAKSILEQESFELLLIDHTIGENHSGVNFAMSIRNRYPDMVRFLMIDQVKKETVEAMQQEIIDDYVEKPVSPAAIIEKMRERYKDQVVP